MKGNARIESTMLGYEDHGILTCFLMLKQESAVQGFGGYRLDAPKDEPCIAGTFWIKRVLDTVGVTKWEELKGKYVRVEGEPYGDIIGIGHITDDKWFYPKKETEELLSDPHKPA